MLLLPLQCFFWSYSEQLGVPKCMITTTCKMLSKKIQSHHYTTLGEAKRGRTVSNTIFERLQAFQQSDFVSSRKSTIQKLLLPERWLLTTLCQAPKPVTVNSTSANCKQFSKFCSYKFVNIAKNVILSLSFSFKYEKLHQSHWWKEPKNPNTLLTIL